MYHNYDTIYNHCVNPQFCEFNVSEYNIHMVAATFGGLLKDVRIKKDMSQQDIAFAMGWSEPSRLSRIEQGKTKKPTRGTIDALVEILRLDRAEKGQLYLSGGYLPTKEEIEVVRQEVESLFTQWPYPAYLLDFAWRLVAWNSHAAYVYVITDDIDESVQDSVPCSLEFVFNPEFPQNKYLTDEKEIAVWRNLQLEKLVRFRLAHQGNTSERWYQDIIQRLMKFPLFVEMWKKVHKQSEEKGIANYEYKNLVDPEHTEQRLAFHILRSPLLQDPRFLMNYHIPANRETIGRYNEFSTFHKNLHPTT